MNYLHAGSFGLILDSGDPKIRIPEPAALAKHPANEIRAHFVLDRYTVDDDGHITLTPSLTLNQLRDQIGIIQATLDSLIREASERFAERHAERRCAGY